MKLRAALPTCLLVMAGLPGVAWCGQPPGSPLPVGSRKQLFIDERFIATSRGVHLVMNPPVKANQPVLASYLPWEGERGAACGSGGAIAKEGGRIRFWGAGRPLLPVRDSADGPVVQLVSYAESADGLHFRKPDPSLCSYDVAKAEIGRHGGGGVDGIWVDPNAPPHQRYKAQGKFYAPRETDEDRKEPVFRIYASPDGYRWTLFAEEHIGECDTQSILFWDGPLGRYLLFTRHTPLAGTPARARMVRRLESVDLLHWDHETVVMQADATDLASYRTPTPQPPVDYYGGAVFRYPDQSADSVYIMLAQAYWHWREYPPELQGGGKGRGRNELAPAVIDVRLAVSRDGLNFQRAGGRRPFIGVGLEGTFCSRRTWAIPNPVRMGDELWIYYYGSSRDHNWFDDPVAGNICGVDRAILRLDGFVSADAGYAGGELVTPAIVFAGRRLELNFDGGAGGSVRVELLDGQGRPIPGYAGEHAVALYGNSVRLPVRWAGDPDLGSLAGRPVRLRFLMRDCKLYAFQFTDRVASSPGG
jgi:hypothetical protein